MTVDLTNPDNIRLATLRTRLKAACQAHHFDVATAKANNRVPVLRNPILPVSTGLGLRRKWTAQALTDAAADRRRIAMLLRALRRPSHG